jgi:hypothetical protein
MRKTAYSSLAYRISASPPSQKSRPVVSFRAPALSDSGRPLPAKVESRRRTWSLQARAPGPQGARVSQVSGTVTSPRRHWHCDGRDEELQACPFSSEGYARVVGRLPSRGPRIKRLEHELWGHRLGAPWPPSGRAASGDSPFGYRGHWQVAFSSIMVCLPMGHSQRVATHRPHSGSMQISNVVSLGSCERHDGAVWLEHILALSPDVDIAADPSCPELLHPSWESVVEAHLLTLSSSLSTSLHSEFGATVASASIFSRSARFVSLTSS